MKALWSREQSTTRYITAPKEKEKPALDGNRQLKLVTVTAATTAAATDTTTEQHNNSNSSNI